MRISSLDPQQGRGDRVNLIVDGEFRMRIPAELAIRVGLVVGQPITEEQLADLADRDERWRAREAAYRLVAHRERSAGELSERLRRKGYGAKLIDEVVESLRATGLLDDTAFAEAFTRERLRSRPRSQRLLRQELRTRGIEDSLAAEVVPRVAGAEGSSDATTARAAAERWLRRHPAPPPGEEGPAGRLRHRRRLYAFLSRRGYSGDVIREVLTDVLA